MCKHVHTLGKRTLISKNYTARQDKVDIKPTYAHMKSAGQNKKGTSWHVTRAERRKQYYIVHRQKSKATRFNGSGTVRCKAT